MDFEYPEEDFDFDGLNRDPRVIEQEIEDGIRVRQNLQNLFRGIPPPVKSIEEQDELRERIQNTLMDENRWKEVVNRREKEEDDRYWKERFEMEHRSRSGWLNSLSSCLLYTSPSPRDA
eukprot:TRINITY_DN4377_c0_g1_i1.p1 TRINITY_DN4377_c0_g1~~TRINITY_DN4377_c0_g1_i1.p1  ORF type:complete len:119 (+),score=23.63 TRINITY_DN4377_c0_g1_i1:77-433(+)